MKGYTPVPGDHSADDLMKAMSTPLCRDRLLDFDDSVLLCRKPAGHEPTDEDPSWHSDGTTSWHPRNPRRLEATPEDRMSYLKSVVSPGYGRPVDYSQAEIRMALDATGNRIGEIDFDRARLPIGDRPPHKGYSEKRPDCPIHPELGCTQRCEDACRLEPENEER